MNGGGAGRPRLFFDHALVALPDLDESVRAFEARYGLAARAGGRHPGAGTANAIVPLSAQQYLELIAVVDPGEAGSSSRSGRVARAVAAGEVFASWALRSDDLDALGAIAGGEVREGARVRPDGRRLGWRTLELGAPAAGSGVPFVIEWAAGSPHPSEGGEGRVRRVLLEADGELARLLDAVDVQGVEMEVRSAAGPRLAALELSLPGREIRIG